jgi:hypothetical protein
MRTSTDVLRSMKRYVSLAFDAAGMPWEVRLESQITHAPLAIVTQTTPITQSNMRFVVQQSMGMRVACYPGPAVDEEAAVLMGGAIDDVLFGALRRGVVGGRPLRVPLYDYDGIGKDSPSTVRESHDFIRLTGVNVQPIFEPEDRTRVTVLCAFTATWFRAGEKPEIDRGPLNTGGVVVSGP